ncbi:caspase family protein [Arthrospira platensis SPKY2]
MVVGINSYRMLDELGTAANDANAIAQCLLELGFDVIGLPSASSEEAWQVDPKKYLLTPELEDAITNLFALSASVSIPETALLFFAGHGQRKVKGTLAEGFLATSGVDPPEIPGLSLQKLRNILDKSPVKEQIVILDCCYAGELLNFDEAQPSNGKTISRCFITACREFERAKEPTQGEHSFLTEAILKGLKQEGILTSVHLCNYLQKTLEKHNPKPYCNTWGEIILRQPEVESTDEILQDECPYKGLKAFTKEDSEYFFGRIQLTHALAHNLRNHKFLAVLGNSGSGKSSIVRAGLIPQLEKDLKISQSQSWKIYDPFKPGDNPIESLARVLEDENHSIEEIQAELKQGAEVLQRLISRENNPCVLVVDQFEQVFQSENEANRQRFFDCLVGAVKAELEPSIRVVITMRADFLGECLKYPELAQLIKDNQEFVTEMNDAELREAITEPAQKLGWPIPESLADRIVKDMQGLPEKLPLLQYILESMWNQRGKKGFPKAYDDMGGVQEALQRQADQVYESLTEEKQKIAQKIFLILTHFGEGIQPTCRQVRKFDLLSQFSSKQVEKVQVETVLNQLQEAGLLVIRKLNPTKEAIAKQDDDALVVVDVAHETLIRNWEKLKQWINENPQVELQKRKIEEKAQEWKSAGKPRYDLLKGSELVKAEDLINAFPLSGISLEFVQKSIRRRNAERIFIAGTVATVLAVVTGLWVNAQRQSTIAKLGEKAARAENLASVQPVQGLVAAIQAAGESQDKLRQVISPVHNSLVVATQAITEQNRFQGHQDAVWAVAFSPDGQTIVSSSSDNTVRLWNLEGQQIEELRGHQNQVNAVAFSPDGQIIASGSSDNTVRLWNLKGQQIKELSGHENKVWAVAFSPDGQIIASGSSDNTVRLWNLKGQQIKELSGHENTVAAVAFSPDGQTIASGSSDNTVRLWNLRGEQIAELSGHDSSVWAVAFSPDGQTIAIGSADNTVRLWNLQGEEIAKLSGHEREVLAVAFSPDGQTIVSAAQDNTVRLWNLQGQEIRELQGHQSGVLAVAFSPDGQTIASGSYDNTVRLWKPEGEVLREMRGHQGGVNAVAFSPNGETIVSGGADNTLRLWKPTGEVLREMRGHQNQVWAVAISPDGETIVSASYDNTLRLWNRMGEAIGNPLRGHQNQVWAVAFSPDGKTIVSGSYDNTARLWSSQGEPLRQLRGHHHLVSAVAFSPDGETIVTGSSDKTLRLWNLQGQEIAKLSGHQNWVDAVAFSPDGQIIASGGADNTVRLWNLQGQQIGELQGHQSPIRSVAFSPDGKTIVSAAQDNTVRLWNLQGQQIGELRGNNWFMAVAFSPDGQSIISGGGDGIVRLSPLGWENFLQIGCRQLQHHRTLVTPETDVARDVGNICQKYAWTPAESADFLVRQGNALADRGEIRAAVAKFKEALKLNPNLDMEPETKAQQMAVPGLVAEGITLAYRGDYGLAVAKFQQALQIDPTLDLKPEDKAKEIVVPVLVEMGENFAFQGRYYEALEKFKEAINIDHSLDIEPEDKAKEITVRALLEQAEQLAKTRKIEAAIAAFQEAISLDDSLDIEPQVAVNRIAAVALVEEGKNSAARGDYEEARQRFKEAITYNPNLNLDPDKEAKMLSIKAWTEWADQQLKEGKYQGAIDSYKEAQKIDQNLVISARNWNRICWFGSLRGHAEVAIEACENAVKLNPDSAMYRGNLAISKAINGDTDGAVQDFDKFLNMTEDEELKSQVLYYIYDLENGNNPFTEAEVSRLLGDSINN